MCRAYNEDLINILLKSNIKNFYDIITTISPNINNKSLKKKKKTILILLLIGQVK